MAETVATRFVSKYAAHHLTGRDGAYWAIYPFDWCPYCGRETPHAGPYCQAATCGMPNECWPGCADQGECRGCDRRLCIDHSPDFYGCDATGDWHDACHDIGCGNCQNQAAREWVEEHR